MGFFLRFFFRGIVYSTLAWGLYSAIQHFDVSKIIHSHVPGHCQQISGIEHGSEDVDVLPSGKAIFSTGLQLLRKLSGPDAPDPAMMVYDVTTPNEPAKVLKITGYKGTLNPHGLSLFLENDKVYVYVVNHPPFFSDSPPGDMILKFLWNVDKDELVHQSTITDPEFVGLNDLVVVGKDQFYVSNFVAMKSTFLRELEMFMWFLPLQNVVYYDGTKGKIVLSGMYGSNGVDVSPDKQTLYVSEAMKRRVGSYRIKTPTNLVWQDAKYLGSMPDNINVDEQTGDLWVGCHPVFHHIFRRFLDTSAKSPGSQIIRIEASDGKFGNTEDIFVDDGQKLSMSSAAAYHKGKNMVLMGTVADRAMVCKCESCGL